jgi:two-component system, OmpR family, sensor kinase
MVKKLIRKHWLTAVILLPGVLLTLISVVLIQQQTSNRNFIKFETDTSEISQNIDISIKNYISLLRAGAGLFAANDQNITKDQFQTFVQRLQLEQNYPGILAVGYSRVTDAESVPRLINEAGRQGVVDFSIWPEHPRPEYHTIFYIEPMNERNQAAVGYDMFTEPVRRTAMERARDTGHSSMSGRVTLVQEIGEVIQPGFLIYVPIYKDGKIPLTEGERKENLDAFMYGPFRAGDFFSTIYDIAPKKGIEFQIYDGEGVLEENLLYTSPGYSKANESSFSRVFNYDVAGHTWTVHYRALPTYSQNLDTPLAPIVFFIGLLITLAAYYVVRQQINFQKDLDEKKDEFIGVASHELKTPVTSIKAFTQILARRCKKTGDVDSFEMLRKMDRHVNRLSEHINELLDITKISANELNLNLERFRLEGLIEEVIDETELSTSSHKIIRKVKCQAEVYADRERIRQVITNLIDNAIKYSPRGENIIVELKCKNRSACLFVKDFGIGIPVDEQQKVFDRYYRSENRSTENFGGLGLGLYISSEIIKQHGGKIRVKGKPNKGSTFYFNLPLFFEPNE